MIASESSHRRGGRNPALMSMANYVSILHADQTVATYAHLAPGGVRVRPGERFAGTPIGYSGPPATLRAALHFVVQKLVRQNEGFAAVSLPLRFLRRRSAVCLPSPDTSTG
ncbi:MAG: hypothetical protein IPP85_12880 [Propionivibrio sp.]|nr:hypothetical protein [Propionivibrio sp.]